MKKLANPSQVERTLQLWADGEMKAENTGPARKQPNKPTIKAVSKLNPATGVISNATSKFSAENWGSTTRNYFRSINKMKPVSLEEIMQLATLFMSPLKSRRQGSSHSVGEDEDIRACLMDD